MTDPIRVFLVDDQRLVRTGFAMILDATPDMEVVGHADDGQAALDVLRAPGAPRVDVVLMDLRMPILDGVSATRRLCARREAGGPPRVLVLTTFDIDEDVLAALRAGASGYLLKDAGATELLAAIRSVHAGDSVVAPSATRRLIDTFVLQPPGREPDSSALAMLDRLTDREREILVAVGRGMTNQEVATGYFLAEATVKTHVGALLRKLEQRDRVGLVVFAHETDLV